MKKLLLSLFILLICLPLFGQSNNDVVRQDVVEFIASHGFGTFNFTNRTSENVKLYIATFAPVVYNGINSSNELNIVNYADMQASGQEVWNLIGDPTSEEDPLYKMREILDPGETVTILSPSADLPWIAESDSYIWTGQGQSMLKMDFPVPYILGLDYSGDFSFIFNVAKIESITEQKTIIFDENNSYTKSFTLTLKNDHHDNVQFYLSLNDSDREKKVYRPNLSPGEEFTVFSPVNGYSTEIKLAGYSNGTSWGTTRGKPDYMKVENFLPIYSKYLEIDPRYFYYDYTDRSYTDRGVVTWSVDPSGSSLIYPGIVVPERSIDPLAHPPLW